MHSTDYEDNKSDSHVSCVHKTIHSHILSYKTRFSSSPVAFHHLHSKMDADSYNTFSPETNYKIMLQRLHSAVPLPHICLESFHLEWHG